MNIFTYLLVFKGVRPRDLFDRASSHVWGGHVCVRIYGRGGEVYIYTRVSTFAGVFHFIFYKLHQYLNLL